MAGAAANLWPKVRLRQGGDGQPLILAVGIEISVIPPIFAKKLFCDSTEKFINLGERK